jgi:hypothetical protein
MKKQIKSKNLQIKKVVANFCSTPHAKEVVKRIFQGLIIGFFYITFLIFDTMYEVLGLSHEPYKVLKFVALIPVKLLALLTFFCCNKINDLAYYEILANLAFMSLLFSTIFVIFKLNIKTWKIIAKSIQIGILSIPFIENVVVAFIWHDMQIHTAIFYTVFFLILLYIPLSFLLASSVFFAFVAAFLYLISTNPYFNLITQIIGMIIILYWFKIDNNKSKETKIIIGILTIEIILGFFIPIFLYHKILIATLSLLAILWLIQELRKQRKLFILCYLFPILNKIRSVAFCNLKSTKLSKNDKSKQCK